MSWLGIKNENVNYKSINWFLIFRNGATLSHITLNLNLNTNESNWSYQKYSPGSPKLQCFSCKMAFESDLYPIFSHSWQSLKKKEMKEWGKKFFPRKPCLGQFFNHVGWFDKKNMEKLLWTVNLTIQLKVFPQDDSDALLLSNF